MSHPDPGFVAFVESRSSALLRTAILLCHGDRRAADAALHATLVKSYLSWGTIRRPDAAEPFARALLVRGVVSAAQPHRVDSTSAARPREPPVVDHASDVGSRLRLWSYLAALTGRQRGLVVLRFHEDLSNEQSAHVLECSRAAVRTDAANALVALREQLGRDDDTGQRHGVGPPPDELGRLLARRMRHAVEDAGVTNDFLSSVLTVAPATRRRRRLKAAAVSATAAVAVATLIAVASATSESPRPVGSPSASTTTRITGSVQPARPYAWAGTLPEGPAPSVPYFSGGSLVVGTEQFPLDASGGTVLGQLPGGYFVSLHSGTLREGGVRYALVTRAGNERPLPPARDTTVRGGAVAPDAQRLVYGGHVVDVASQRVVIPMPGDARRISGWIRAGVVYRNVAGDTRLWRPDNEAMRLGLRLPGPIGPGETLVDAAGQCGRAVQVGELPAVTTLYQDCAEGAPVAVSPQGQLVLTDGGRAVDLVTGDRTSLPLPLIQAARDNQVGWEDEHTIVFPVYRARDGTAERVRFVRCTTPGGGCVLAGPGLTTTDARELRQ